MNYTINRSNPTATDILVYDLEANGPNNRSTPRQVVQSRPAYPIVQIGGNDTIKVDGDYADYFPAGLGFIVVGSTANDGSYTVNTAFYDGGQDETNVQITTTFPDTTGDGEARINGFTLHGDLTYRFVNAFTFDVQKSFGPTITAVVVGLNGTFTFGDIDEGAVGRFQQQLPNGSQFGVTGSTGNDGIYTVQSTAFVNTGPGVGDTTVTITGTVADGTVDGLLNINDGTYTVVALGSYLASSGTITVIPVSEDVTNIDSPLGQIQYGQADLNTTLRLPGRGSLNYGERLLENLVRITENWAADDAPELNTNIGDIPAGTPMVGQFWYNTTAGSEGYSHYDSGAWTRDWDFDGGSVIFKDPENSAADIYLTGAEANLPAPWAYTAKTGMVVWPQTTTVGVDDPIFRVLSFDGTERLSVENGRYTYTNNSFKVERADPQVLLDTTVTDQTCDVLFYDQTVLAGDIIVRADTAGQEMEINGQSQNDVLITPVSGNVGIGTTSATSTLVIKDRIFFDEGLGNPATGPDIRFTTDGLIAAYDGIYLNVDGDNSGGGTGGFVKLLTGGTTSAAAEFTSMSPTVAAFGTDVLYVDITNSRVAVNNAAPTAPFQIGTQIYFDEGGGDTTVASDIRFDTNGLITADASVHINIQGDGVTASSNFDVRHGGMVDTSTLLMRVNDTQAFIDTDTLFVDIANDRVAINNAAPTAPFQIGTQIYFDEGGGDPSVAPDVRFAAAGMIAADDILYINTDTDNDGVGLQGVVFKAGGSTTAATTFMIAQPTKFDYGLGILYVDGSNSRVAINNSGPTAPFQIGTQIYFDEGGGDASVNPDIRFAAEGLISADTNLHINVAGAGVSGALDIRHGSHTNVATLLMHISDTEAYFDTDTLYVDIANDRVAINNAAPTAPFQIGTQMYFDEGGGVAATGPDVRFTTDGLIVAEENVYINIDSDNTLAGTNSFQIKEGGTTSAATTILHVDSTKMFFDTNMLYVDATNNLFGIGKVPVAGFDISVASVDWTIAGAGDMSYTGNFTASAASFGLSVGGTARLNIESDGTISTSTPTYESLVTADNDIPNKKYVDDVATAQNELAELTDTTITTPADGEHLVYSTPAGNKWVNTDARPQYELATATGGQTIINTTIPTSAFTGSPGRATMQVHKNGVMQIEGASYAFTVTGANQITFTAGLIAGDVITMFSFE